MIEINRNNRKINIKMGWKYITYIYGKEKLVFNIEPMIGEADVIYIPNDQIWNNSTIEWVKENKEKIINDIKSIGWNRDIVFKELDIELRCISIDKDEFEIGTIESIKAAKEFQNLNLFDPDKKVEKEQAHELWRTLEKRFAEEVEGKVTIYSNSIIENSVFNKITIPTLLKNDKIILNIVESK